MLAKGLTGHKSQGLGLRPYMIHADRSATEELGWYFTVLTRLITKPSDTELDLAIIDGPCPSACSQRTSLSSLAGVFLDALAEL